MHNYLKDIPTWLLLGLCLAAVVFLGYVDYLTGDYSILIFYMIPVGVAAWGLGGRGGVAISVASGAARIVSDHFSYVNSSPRLWNSFEDTVFLMVLGFLIAKINALLTEDSQKS